MEFIGTLVIIFVMGLQAYLAHGNGSSIDKRRRQHELALAMPDSEVTTQVFSGMVAATTLSQSIFNRLQIVEQTLEQQQDKVTMQQGEISLLKTQVREQQEIINEQATVIDKQSTRLSKHSKQIRKLRQMLKELGKEVTDEELEALADEDNP